MTKRKQTPSEKRLHVMITDKESIKWLESQNNMSASLRLLIQQIARTGNTGDYVLHCAQQAPSPFGAGYAPQANPQVSAPVEPTVQESGYIIEETGSKADDSVDENGVVAPIEAGLVDDTGVEPQVVDEMEPDDTPDEVVIPEPEEVTPMPVEPIEEPEPVVEVETPTVEEVPERETEVPEPADADDDATDSSGEVDWEKYENDKQDRIARMMADLGRA